LIFFEYHVYLEPELFAEIWFLLQLLIAISATLNVVSVTLTVDYRRKNGYSGTQVWGLHEC